jgi:hypothetical protein
MTWKKFLATYIPFSIAGLFIIGFLGDDYGWHLLASRPQQLLPYLGGIAFLFILLSFGAGAVFWMIGYFVYEEKPSYLKSVLNTLIFIVVLIGIGGVAEIVGWTS